METKKFEYPSSDIKGAIMSLVIFIIVTVIGYITTRSLVLIGISGLFCILFVIQILKSSVIFFDPDFVTVAHRFGSLKKYSVKDCTKYVTYTRSFMSGRHGKSDSKYGIAMEFNNTHVVIIETDQQGDLQNQLAFLKNTSAINRTVGGYDYPITAGVINKKRIAEFFKTSDSLL